MLKLFPRRAAVYIMFGIVQKGIIGKQAVCPTLLGLEKGFLASLEMTFCLALLCCNISGLAALCISGFLFFLLFVHQFVRMRHKLLNKRWLLGIIVGIADTD